MAAPRTTLLLLCLAVLAISVSAVPSANEAAALEAGWPSGPLRFVPRDESKPFFRRQAGNKEINGSYVLTYTYPQNVQDYMKTWASSPAPLVANASELNNLYWPPLPPSYENWKKDAIKSVQNMESQGKLKNCTFAYTGPLLHSAACQIPTGQDTAAIMKELEAMKTTFDYVEHNIELATPPNNGSITPSGNPWVCIKDISKEGSGEYAPVHVDIDGEVACMATADRKACLWTKTNATCMATVAKPPEPILEIQCGDDHKSIFGFTGYDAPDSWCNSLNKTTNSTADGRPSGRLLTRLVDSLFARQNSASSPRTTQSPVKQNWDIDRINQRNLPMDSKYDYFTTAGSGVTVYVIDTGIRITHSEFEGRASWGITTCASKGCPDADDQGHGTFVAGLVAGKVLGVAKKTNVVAIKALNSKGSGTNSDIIAGIEWAINDYKKRGAKPSVINMSLGGGKSDALNRAVLTAVSMGIHVVTAAGNEDSDACAVSPASASPGTPVITVGSTNKNDVLSSYSNWGTCVDILAPGEDVVSASNKGDTQASQNSGTSFSCPTVAGVMALHLGNNVNQGVAITPDALKKTIIADSTLNVIRIPSGSRASTPNKLLYSGAEQGTPSGTTRPPAQQYASAPPEQYGSTTSSSGLSTGAIIGIVVGVGLAAALIAFFVVRHQKAKKTEKAAQAQQQQQQVAEVKYQQPPAAAAAVPVAATATHGAQGAYAAPGYAAPATTATVTVPAPVPATTYAAPTYAPPPTAPATTYTLSTPQPANLYSAPSYAEGVPVDGTEWSTHVGTAPPPAAPPRV